MPIVEKRCEMFEIKASSKMYTPDGVLPSSAINQQVQKTKALISAATSRESVIAFVFVSRSEKLIYAVSALLQLQIPFVLADTTYPPTRLRYMLEDCGASLIITEDDQYQLLGKDIRPLCSNKSFTLSCRVGSPISKEYDWSKIAYIVYTSGTTGRPKGVVIPTTALHSFIKGFSTRLPIQRPYTILSIASVSFDAFIIESALPIALGMQMCIATEAERKNPRLLSKLLQRVQPDIMFFTPTTLEMLNLVDQAFLCLGSLKIILIGGEALSDSLLVRLQEKTDARIFNVYGPTESTVIVSAEELTQSSDISLGSSIKGVQMFLINDVGERIHMTGIPGEICISGNTLAAGYLNNMSLTAQKFCVLDGNRSYHTGDLGILSENGKIKFVGRCDSQVKIRGNRVELGEIEIAIGQEPGVKQVAVISFERANHTELAAFFTASDYVDIAQLREHLKDNLPQYMIPTYFKHIANFHLNNNGKLDRNWLRKELYNE